MTCVSITNYFQTLSLFFFFFGRASSTKSRGTGVLIAVSSRVRTFKRKYELRSYDECVWLEISNQVAVVYLLVITILPDTKLAVISEYFCTLEKNLDSVLLIGDFNASNFDWERGICSKLKGDAIYTSICLLGLTLLVATDNSLELVYSNFNRVSTLFADVCVVKSDSCHPSLAIGISLDLHNSKSYHEHSYCTNVLLDYSLLLSFLSNYDWSCVQQ